MADDWILELLQPWPHQAGEDHRVSFITQPLPSSLSGVQLCLYATRNAEDQFTETQEVADWLNYERTAAGSLCQTRQIWI